MRLFRIVRLAPAALLWLGAALAGCGGGKDSSNGTGPTGGGAGGSTSNAITVGLSSFSPPTTTVAAGTTVTWTWDSCGDDGYGGRTCVTHNVTFDDGSAATSGNKSNGTYSRAFEAAGTYHYHCSIHGSPTSGMRGTVVVQ